VATKVEMPLLSQTMSEGTVSRWIRQEGEELQKGEPLLEVETDKALVEVPAPEDGVLLKILAEVNQSVPVGGLLGVLGAEGEDFSSLLRKGPTPPPMESRTEASAPVVDQVSARTPAKMISPRARRLAEEHHIDWRNLRSSGADGQITEKDIQAVIGGTKKGTTAQPLSRARQMIAEGLTKSLRERVHIHLTTTIDMAEAIAFRNALLQEAAARKAECEIAFNDILVKALGICLAEFPWVNSSWADEGVICHPFVHVGLAVATDDHALLVPVIRDVQRLNLRGIAEVRLTLVKKARGKRLLPDEMTGGTFTLSNLGMYGVEQFTAIINPPETGILAVGAITEEPRVFQGSILARPVMRVTLGVDHRIVDGALGAQFLRRFKDLLEHPNHLAG